MGPTKSSDARFSLFDEDSESVREKLLFSRGVLSILKETDLFGPLIDQAIEDLDYLLLKIH